MVFDAVSVTELDVLYELPPLSVVLYVYEFVDDVTFVLDVLPLVVDVPPPEAEVIDEAGEDDDVAVDPPPELDVAVLVVLLADVTLLLPPEFDEMVCAPP